MPHVLISMFPGRSREVKADLAVKVQEFLSQELALDKKVVSVSIEDIPMEDWAHSMERFPSDTMYVDPGV